MNFIDIQFFLAATIIPLCVGKSYDGYQIIRAYPESTEHLQVLRRHFEDAGCCKFHDDIARPVDLLAKPKKIQRLRRDLDVNDIRHEVIIRNVQQTIEAQKRQIAKDKITREDEKKRFDFKSYQRKAEIDTFLDDLEKRHSDVVKKEIVGYSVEGRSLPLLTLSDGSPKKKAIWIDGGIHAREWISPAVTLYLLKMMVEDRTLLEEYDVYSMPLTNPDGYEYTHTDDRMWRKNRAGTGKCRGVDLNRNFDNHFAGTGASNDSCSAIYHGPEPFSEPETKAMRDAIVSRADKIKLFLTMHSYGQVLLIPYGYVKPAVLADNFDAMKLIADNGIAALRKVNGTVFEDGNTVKLLGAASGATDDWAKENVGIEYVYTVELRDTDGGAGFLLPPEQIIPSGEEMWACLKAMCKTIVDFDL